MRQWLLLVITICLGLVGVVTLKSVAPALAGLHVGFLLLGTCLFLIVQRYHSFLTPRMAWVGYWLITALLALTMVSCTVTRGTCSWIELGSSFHLQSSQLAIALVGLAISIWVTQHPLAHFKNLAFLLVSIALPALLILIEPDLGTTVIYLLSVGSIVFVGPTRWSHLLWLGLAGLLVVTLSWTFIVKDYQKERIVSFVAASKNVSDAHYNAQQALIAVGSGQLWGQGLGQGIQSHLRFLPERQTDFIFASLAEEWGFLGSVTVIALYCLLIGWILYLAFTSATPAAHYYGCITAIFLTIQTTVNIGMNIGLFPITGITLPFISYGGSSVLSLYVHLAILQALTSDTMASHHLHIG